VVVGVLYADRGESDAAGEQSVATTWSGTLELLALHAARCLEAATAARAVRALTEFPQIQFGAPSIVRDGQVS
jgi:hypothetical protein